MIERFMKAMAKNEVIVFFRILGFVLVVVGIVTAGLNAMWAGFTPVVWLLLGICSFLGVICHTLYRIVISLEKEGRSE